MTVHIAPAAVVPFEQVNLEAADPDSRQRLLEGIARTATSGRFDLSAPPLLRATLVREAPDSHVLLLVFHHIIADGTSFLKLFPGELAELYPALRDGRTPVPLPPVSSYRDFVRASLGDEQRARVESDLGYWQEALAGAPPYLPLPTDHPYPARPSGQGVRLEQRLPPEVRQRVQQLADERKVRPFDVTAAAFVALLGRYSEAEEVVLGTPIANRGPTFKHTIGCFINALVLRTPLRDDLRFQDLISELGQIRREARHHANVPFGELIDHLGGARDAARNPIYQVMFNYLDFSLDDLRIEGLQVEGWRASAGTAMLDLSLDVTEQSDGGYLLCLEASTDLFDAEHVGRMLGHYQELLLAGLAVPPATSGSWVSSPPPSGRKSPRWRGGRRCRRRSPKKQLPFHELVALRAQRWGDRVAVRSEQRSLTYRELVEAFHAVGEGLQRQGVVAGELVLVGAGDDPCDTLTLILGVMAAGAAYVPLDSASPPARQQAVQADCGARWLLGGAGFDDRWQPPGLRVLAFDPARPGWPDSAPAVAPSQLSRLPLSPLDRPAYLMYTSGSTGTPKGVLISQRNLVHQCRARLQRYDDAPGILLGTYSFAFDSSLAGISHALCAGGTLRFAGERLRRDPAGLRQLIAGEGITHLDMVPSAYAGLLAESTRRGPAQPAGGRLRRRIAAGRAGPAPLPAGPAGAPVQRIRPDRGHRVRDRARAGGGRGGDVPRSGSRWATPAAGCWMPGDSWCRWGTRASCTSAAAGWPRVTTGGRRTTPGRSCGAGRMGAPSSGFTAPAIRCACAPAVPWTWSAGATIRCSCAVTGWSWARWRRCCARRPGEGRGGGAAIGSRDPAPAGRLLRAGPVGGPRRRPFASSCRPGCRRTWFRRCWFRCRPCGERRGASWTAIPCPAPSRAPPAPPFTRTRAPPPRCAWRGCGSGCWARTASAGPTTSSPWAATRCWR